MEPVKDGVHGALRLWIKIWLASTLGPHSAAHVSGALLLGLAFEIGSR